MPSSSSSLSVTTSPVTSGAAGEHDVERLVEHDLLAARRARRASISGCSATRILRPPVNTSTVPSSLLADDRAVGRRRLGELLDLLAQRGDVLARLAQGVASASRSGRPPGPAGPWSRAAAPRACGPASARPAAGGAGRRPLPRGASTCSLELGRPRVSYSVEPPLVLGRHDGPPPLGDLSGPYSCVQALTRASDTVRDTVSRRWICHVARVIDFTGLRRVHCGRPIAARPTPAPPDGRVEEHR